MEGEEGQRRGGSIEGQASARGRGRKKGGGRRGGRWQIFWPRGVVWLTYQ